MNFQTGQDFAGIVKVLIDLINLVIPVLGGAALVLFLFGVVRYIYRSGNAKSRKNEREIMYWGLIALFVLFSIWGILKLMSDALLPTADKGSFDAQTCATNGHCLY